MAKEKLSIVKIGGNIIENNEALHSFLVQFSKIEGKKILVHGGGKSATIMASKLGVATKMIDGRRITDSESLKIITMMYAGLLNKSIVVQLQSLNCDAIGMSGADANAIRSVKRPVKEIDFGWVGDVTSVNSKSLKKLIDASFIPVFCALTHDGNGQLLNTNADTITAELAIGLSNLFETEIYYCFELNGVLMDITNKTSVISTLTKSKYDELLEKHLISEGMLPKLKNCFDALQKGVRKVYIGNQNLFSGIPSNYTTIQL